MGAPLSDAKAADLRLRIAKGDLGVSTGNTLTPDQERQLTATAQTDPNTAAGVMAQVQKDRANIISKMAPPPAPDLADIALKASRFGLLGQRTRQSSFLGSGSKLGG